MNPSEMIGAIFGISLPIGAYLIAFFDWRRLTNEELADGARRGWMWTLAALLTVAGMALSVFVGLGRNGLSVFMGEMGWFLVFQSMGLLWLMQTGSYWAGEVGVSPFRWLRRSWREWPVSWLTAGWAVAAGWTAGLAVLAWKAGWLAADVAESGAFKLAGLDLGAMPWPAQVSFAISLMTFAPIVEESLFRHYLLYRIAAGLRRWPWGMTAAIAATSIMWGLGHGSMIGPWWLKLVQIAGIGLVLGETARRHGLECAITLHWVFNITVAVVIGVLAVWLG